MKTSNITVIFNYTVHQGFKPNRFYAVSNTGNNNYFLEELSSKDLSHFKIKKTKTKDSTYSQILICAQLHVMYFQKLMVHYLKGKQHASTHSKTMTINSP